MKIIYLVLVYFVVVMGNTSLVLSDLTIEEKQQLFDALQLALINNSTNLFQLQQMFYPPREVSPDTVEFTSIVTVNEISITDETRCYPRIDAFKNSSDLYYYVRNTDFNTDRFLVSNDAFSNFQAKLTDYVNSINETLEELEYVSYHIIMTITNMRWSTPSIYLDFYVLNFEVDKLDVMPCEEDYVDAMSAVLSWARYYAKLYNHDPLKDTPSKTDTERGISSYCDVYEGWCDNNSANDNISELIAIFYLLSILIAIVGIYCVNLFITKYESYQHTNATRKVFNSIYWASVIIAGIINITCVVEEFRCLNTEDPSLPFFSDFYYFFRLPLMIFIFLVEPVAVFIVVKKFRIPSCVCGCCSRPLVMRLVHTLAICHLLWFLHRVGLGLIVAAFFIALAPGKTIAALSLMYLVILVSTVYVACFVYSIQNRRKKCKMVCKLFLLTITYLCLVGLAICFTLIYINLFNNGLTSSTIGHLLLSLVPPMAIFFIGVAIKRQLKESNILEIESSDSDSSVSDEVRDQVKSDECTPLVQ